MAIRTTELDVSKIIELDATIDLDPFIEVASALVDEVCVPNVSYTATRLELVERWLSAFFYAIRDPRSNSESAGGVSASYQKTSAIGFDTNEWGQMAMRLATGGELSALNERIKKGTRKTANVYYLGKDRYEAEAEADEDSL